MANVRFYRLGVLPPFDSSKHVGVFVHLIPTEGETHKAGLWFGGATNWEYLTNDTNAIDAAIDAKIQGLDVPGYAQAIITPNEPIGGKPNSTLTILGIQEVDGEISNDSSKNFEVSIDGKYDETDNKIATQTTVTNAITGLNAGTIQAVTTAQATDNTANTVLTFKGVKEENGVIAQGDGATTFTVGNAKLKIQIGSAAATDVFSANATADSTIQLDGNVFTKNGDVISVITPTAVTSSNRLVTEKDVANLAGAMHYKGTVSSLTEFNNKLADSDAEEAGDVYIATGITEGSFTHNGNVIENGDMIVFNGNGANDYKVVQSNITLGIQSGQIAKNDGDLSPNNNVVIATSAGIKTISITEDDLTGTNEGNNSRTLTYTNGSIDDNGFHHAVTITDTFKVIGKDFTKSINITSGNRSIDIAANGETGVKVDLVWNTSIE